VTRATPIPETVTLHVPFRVVKRGGRKEMRLPEGSARPRKIDSALVKALARAFRWKRLTLLAPDIVEAILDGKQGPEVTLARVLEPFPVVWTDQLRSLHRC
jgi:hypothetical protein